jgi:hypothetical protein
MESNLDPVVFSKDMLQFEDQISMAGSFQSFLGWGWKATSILWLSARKCFNSRIESEWLAQSKASSVENGKQLRSCGFQQGNASIRRSNQQGWLIPKFPLLGMESNLDPAVFSKEMLQFEDRISVASSFLSFLGWEWIAIIESVIYWRRSDNQLEKIKRLFDWIQEWIL